MSIFCWIRRKRGEERTTCAGRLQRAHLIPKQRIKLAGITDLDIVWDDRIWRWACAAHHHAFDMKFIHLSEEEYPDSVREWAEEHGFYFESPEGGWRKLA